MFPLQARYLIVYTFGGVYSDIDTRVSQAAEVALQLCAGSGRTQSSVSLQVIPASTECLVHRQLLSVARRTRGLWARKPPPACVHLRSA